MLLAINSKSDTLLAWLKWVNCAFFSPVDDSVLFPDAIRNSSSSAADL